MRNRSTVDAERRRNSPNAHLKAWKFGEFFCNSMVCGREKDCFKWYLRYGSDTFRLGQRLNGLGYGKANPFGFVCKVR